jgi:signal transduction histidine kinase
LAVAVVALMVLLILLIIYIISLHSQLQNIDKQLTKRLEEKTRQPVSVSLFSKKLNSLVVSINKALKEEEVLRIDGIRREKEFKGLIANISHDLRTPLTAIKGYQQLLAKETLSKNQIEKLTIAQKHADELGGLIEHFFEYSYLVNAEQEVKTERINLVNIVAECLVEYVDSLEENNLKVDFYETTSVFVLADREMIRRILQNLIRNCLVHSSGDIRVEVTAKNYGVVIFSNPAKNADEIDIKKLFDRFYTGDKTRSRSTGLGLSIVKLLAERMGGCTSAELEGKVIKIYIKLPLSHK